MLKLKIADAKEKDDTVELKLTQTTRGDIVVEDAHSGYSIVGFKVVDGKVNVMRYRGVSDKNYNTDKNGQIKEVEE